MIYKDKYGRQVLIKCDCGCTYMEVSTFDFEDDADKDYFIVFYRNVNNLSLWQKLKVVKDILLNRDTLIQEIILDKKQFKEFAENISALTEVKL